MSDGQSFPAGDTPAPEQAQGAIDTHAHVFPSDYLDVLEQIGIPSDSITIARGMHADSSAEDMSTRMRWMDRAGVEAQVLAVAPQVPAGPEPGGSAMAARVINDAYAQLVSDRPDRFRFYGALPLPHVDESVAEVPRIFERGALGVALTTVLPGGITPAEARFDPVWQALDDHRAIVNIHATGSGALSPLISDHRLEWVNGAPVEDAIAVLHLLKADIPGRFPHIRFHVAHLGGDLPFLARRIEDNYEDWNAFASSPLASLRDMWFDAANFHEPSLRLAAETFGPERIIAGSDHPYFQGEKYVRAFDYIRDASLPREQATGMLRDNALALYGERWK